ncbi:CGNR zinc finger domain-containing protein [Actinacidiphila sp. bgisy145]|uniref:CGNR zinc finger domain-containing protein n=1 Tax=Actinacidiphila sp. bgisy145 TaxID=3413792 RepID=UPI003EBD79C9
MAPTYDDSSAHHSVQANARRAADLVNALADDAEPKETAAVTAAVAAVLRAYGETEPFGLTPADLADLRAAARRLREVFAAEDADEAAVRLNRLLASGTGPLRLTTHGGTTSWHPHLDSDDDAPWAEWFLASSCLALAVLLWDRRRPPGGVCASPSCPNVYVMEGRGPNRRYCSRRCATRERVAAHRARTRPPEAPEATDEALRGDRVTS